MIASNKRKVVISAVVLAAILGCSIAAYCKMKALHPQPARETAYHNPNLYGGWSAEDEPHATNGATVDVDDETAKAAK